MMESVKDVLDSNSNLSLTPIIQPRIIHGKTVKSVLFQQMSASGLCGLMTTGDVSPCVGEVGSGVL